MFSTCPDTGMFLNINNNSIKMHINGTIVLCSMLLLERIMLAKLTVKSIKLTYYCMVRYVHVVQSVYVRTHMVFIPKKNEALKMLIKHSHLLIKRLLCIREFINKIVSLLMILAYFSRRYNDNNVYL